MNSFIDERPLADRLEKAEEKLLQEILREAEVHLSSQQTVALAADQRALNLAGFLSAAVVVLVGGAASYSIEAEKNAAIATISILMAVAFLVAIWFAVRSAAPTDFDFAGNTPAMWVDDIDAGTSWQRSLAEQCANYAEAIAENDARMKVSGSRIWIAINIVFGSLCVGALSFVVSLAVR